MNPLKTPGLLLAVHPTSRGFGFALFEGPGIPIHWGCVAAPGDSELAMRRFIELVDQYHPSILVLEAYEENSRRRERIRELVETMSGLARGRDMNVVVYDRKAVGVAALDDENATRHEVAARVAERMPVLQAKLPKPRTGAADPEDGQQCVFDAVALGLTYYDRLP